MNTSQASQKWRCSVSAVRNYCKSGVIPSAYKDSQFPFAWVIPDECKKPPMTRSTLCFLLDAVACAHEGAIIDVDAWGFGEEKTLRCYEYLISFQFMTPIDLSKLQSELKEASLTKRGADLIERENKENNKHYRAYIKGSLNLGVVSIEAGTTPQ